MKEEIQRVKEQEEQAMREQEFIELVKRGSTAEDLVYLLTCLSATLYRAPRPWEDPSTLTSSQTEDAVPARLPADTSVTKTVEDGPDDTERNQMKDRHDERKPAKRKKGRET
uniref:Uncharacterized protein n=1 Tax=Brassica campestris TaxID=3711 RepID=A0A3P6CSJ9_BRACM|nr:unnamed protein product [Brassica rapa]